VGRADDVPVQLATLSDGHVFLRATATMNPTDDHIRQVSFWLPRLRPNPVVNATIFPTNSSGPTFALFDVVVEDVEKHGKTHIKLTATYAAYGKPDDRKVRDYDVRCHLMVTGQLAQA
jgi:hypothetical protein